jgi:hypothetical protein
MNYVSGVGIANEEFKLTYVKAIIFIIQLVKFKLAEMKTIYDRVLPLLKSIIFTKYVNIDVAIDILMH